MSQISPYGSWKSPITADLIASSTIGLDQIALYGRDVYWVESRPAEGGRNVVVRRTTDGSISDVTPPEFNARTRVHEYGGGAYSVSGGNVFFSNFSDQRLYRHSPGSRPEPITPEADLRYTDGVVDRRRRRVMCVREDHTDAGREAVNAIVAVPVDGGDTEVLVSGNDFYSNPRLSPDATRLAWLTWSHPNMPWDGTELWVGELSADGAIGGSRLVAGGPDESVFQPEWSPDGVLHFVSDRSGWWNLYRWRDARTENVCKMEAEFGMPQWAFGMRTYAFESADRVVCAYNQHGSWSLATLDTRSGKLTPVETPYTDISSVTAAPGRAVFRSGSATEGAAVVSLHLSSGQVDVLRRSRDVAMAPGYLLRATGYRVSHRERSDGPCLFLRTTERRLWRTCWGETTPAGQEPRWPYRVHLHHSQSWNTVLDEPWLRRTRRQLRWQHRLRQVVSGAARRPVGRGRRGRLRQRRSVSCRAG